MRLDKYLKVSRLIKRRTVANEACDAGRVLVNEKPARASLAVKVGDIIEIQFGTRSVKVEVTDIAETVRKVPVKDKEGAAQAAPSLRARAKERPPGLPAQPCSVPIVRNP